MTGPLKGYSSPKGNQTFEITLPVIFPGHEFKIGFKNGNIDGEMGLRSYVAISRIENMPQGDVEIQTSFGDTTLFRPKNMLIPVGVGILVAGYFAWPYILALLASLGGGSLIPSLVYAASGSGC